MRLGKLSVALLATGSLVVGAIGVAGAVSSANHSNGGAVHVHLFEPGGVKYTIDSIAAAGHLPAGFSCANSAKDLTRIARVERKMVHRITKAQIREVRAVHSGKTENVQNLRDRITSAQQFNSSVGTVASLITAKCSA